MASEWRACQGRPWPSMGQEWIHWWIPNDLLSTSWRAHVSNQPWENNQPGLSTFRQTKEVKENCLDFLQFILNLWLALSQRCEKSETLVCLFFRCFHRQWAGNKFLLVQFTEDVILGWKGCEKRNIYKTFLPSFLPTFTVVLVMEFCLSGWYERDFWQLAFQRWSSMIKIRLLS